MWTKVKIAFLVYMILQAAVVVVFVLSRQERGLTTKGSELQFYSDNTSQYEDELVPVSAAGNDFVTLSITKVDNDCVNLNLSFPENLASRETWLPVNSERSAYVFSAYFDENRTMINIIGARTGSYETFICQLWYSLNHGSIVGKTGGPALSMELPESHGYKYSAAVFQCKLPRREMPRYVSIALTNCAVPRNLLEIRQTAPKSKYDDNFTVCLTPINFLYRRAYELVEWIELNRILGADKFIVYNYSSAGNVAKILSWYSKRGLVDVIQWQLPMKVDTFPKRNETVEIHYFGQVAALNDCLLRIKQTSEYIVAIDLDEFIIPHSSSSHSWKEMLKDIKGQHESFLFRCTFFRKEWTNRNATFPKTAQAKKYGLVSILKVEHENRILPARSRSKYIVRTDAVERLGIHEVNRMKSGHTNSIVVQPETGLLHHYRNWNDYRETQSKIFDDTVVTKFGESLLKNVENVWSEMEDVDMGFDGNTKEM